MYCESLFRSSLLKEQWHGCFRSIIAQRICSGAQDLTNQNNFLEVAWEECKQLEMTETLDVYQRKFKM